MFTFTIVLSLILFEWHQFTWILDFANDQITKIRFSLKKEIDQQFDLWYHHQEFTYLL